MSEQKKFLDSAGVQILWSRIDEKFATKETVGGVDSRVGTLEGKVSALEQGTYDDTEIRGLITDNTEAIALLNGDKETAGSVANTAALAVAEIVAGADAKYDTLKEIAEWIVNDTTGSVEMANDIAALEGLVGTESVATQIENALTLEDGSEKYALASEMDVVLDSAKEYADGLASNYEAAGAVAAAMETIVGLTEEEIDAAIAAAE